MKIAYLVQCHKNVEQLNILFNALQSADNDIYVHVDKKSDIYNDLCTNEKIIMLSENKRVNVKWGGVSQISATLNLIESVVNSNKDYDYVWLISGQDMPIKSNEMINEYLKNNRACFIDISYEENKRNKRLAKRNEVYHLQSFIGKNFIQRLLRNFWYFITGGRYHTFKIFKRKFSNDNFYFGSQWWCLPFDIVCSIYGYLCEHKDFFRFYKHCLCPDESFFQTLLMNHIDIQYEIKPNLVYIDWSGCNDSPRILKSSDFEKLKDSDFLFARKFDIDEDKSVVIQIKEKLLS